MSFRSASRDVPDWSIQRTVTRSSGWYGNIASLRSDVVATFLPSTDTITSHLAMPASSAGVFTVFLPISAATVGMLIYGEQFTTLQAAAFALALVGVVLATVPGRARASAAAWQTPPP